MMLSITVRFSNAFEILADVFEGTNLLKMHAQRAFFGTKRIPCVDEIHARTSKQTPGIFCG